MRGLPSGGQRGSPQAGCPLSLRPLQLEVPPWSQVVTSTLAPKSEPAIIPAARNEPIGLKASDFLPVSVGPTQGGGGPWARAELRCQHLGLSHRR